MAGIAHPSKTMMLAALACIFLAMVFEAVSMSLPSWSRINTPNGITARAGYLAYVNPSQITEKSVLNMGLYEWCLEYGDETDSISCSGTNKRGLPAMGNRFCAGMYEAARILAPIALALMFLALVVGALVFKSVMAWKPEIFWKAPKPLALIAVLLSLFAFLASGASWINWLLLGEYNCQDGMAWNPFQGYSTGFIFQCLACAFALFATLLFCLGMLKLGKIPVQMGVIPKEETLVVEETTYPVTVDSPYMAPVTVAHPQEASYSVSQPMYSQPVY